MQSDEDTLAPTTENVNHFIIKQIYSSEYVIPSNKMRMAVSQLNLSRKSPSINVKPQKCTNRAWKKLRESKEGCCEYPLTRMYSPSFTVVR